MLTPFYYLYTSKTQDEQQTKHWTINVESGHDLTVTDSKVVLWRAL